MEHIIDLRSDTVTLPSKEMLETVLTAPLGDDVFGEDPTVKALQEKVATLLGKEAGLFVPSGTMGNLICVFNHCWQRGCEVILGDLSHIHLFEQGGVAQLGGIHSRPAKNRPDGTFCIKEMENLVRGDNPHWPITSLVCIENTHNIAGGRPLPLEWIDKLGKKCRELGLPLHVDGARLFNAAVALNVAPERLVRDAASVNICVSKGLGAPVGSVIAGSKEFIERAVRLRKVLGGGMRQSGILAAMGIFAVDNATQTIRQDHKHLQMIIEGVSNLGADIINVEKDGHLTNILLLTTDTRVMSAEQLNERLKTCTEEEIKALQAKVICKTNVTPQSKIRLVTNNTISGNDIHLVIKKIKFIVSEVQRKHDIK